MREKQAPLIGLYFTSTHALMDIKWGQVTSEIAPGIYLLSIEGYRQIDGDLGANDHLQVASLTETESSNSMIGWRFYQKGEDAEKAYWDQIHHFMQNSPKAHPNAEDAAFTNRSR
jgi:hypothetical protein